MINPKVWLALKQATRQNIAAYLGLRRSGVTEVNGGVVVSDGYSAQDLMDGITVTKLQTMLGIDETDLYKLFEELVRRLEAPPVEITVPEPTPEPTPDIKPKKFCDLCESKGGRHFNTCPKSKSKK